MKASLNKIQKEGDVRLKIYSFCFENYAMYFECPGKTFLSLECKSLPVAAHTDCSWSNTFSVGWQSQTSMTPLY